MSFRSTPNLITKDTKNLGADGCQSMMLENRGDTNFNVFIDGVPILFSVGDPPLIFDEQQNGEPRNDIFNIKFVAPFGVNPLAILWRDIVTKENC